MVSYLRVGGVLEVFLTGALAMFFFSTHSIVTVTALFARAVVAVASASASALLCVALT